MVVNLFEHFDDYEVAEKIIHKEKNVGSSRLIDNSTLDKNLWKRSGTSLPVNYSTSTPVFTYLTMHTPKIGSVSRQRCSGPPSDGSTTLHSEASGMWECMMCILLNKVNL